MSAPDAAPAPETIRSELPILLALAFPLILTNAGNMLLGLVDVAVCGRLGDTAIAGAGLGNAIFFTLSLFGLGTLFGLDPLLSQAVGAGEQRNARAIFTQGLWLALLIGVPIVLVCLAVALVLPWLGQDPDVVVTARSYLFARLPSLFPFLALTASRSYLQAVGRARSLVVGVIVANLANVPIAIALSFGVPSIGVPALGVSGAGLAAGIATAIQLGVSVAPLRIIERELDVVGARWAPDRALLARAFALGGPIGAQIALEASSFAIVAFLIGVFGALPLGAHQVALAAVGCTFQIALGIGAATSVRVGRAIGRESARGTRIAGLTGIAAGGSVMAFGALLFAIAPRLVARTMTDRADLIDTAVPFLLVAACFQLSDGVQTVAQGALRGAGDTRVPFFLNLLGHFVIGLPIGALLAYGIGIGPVGLWWGLSAGLTAVALLMTVRFVRISRRGIARA
jgi:MATE family multidrug resistance protein